MPRIRDKRGQSVQELAVSPWMTKKGLKEGAEPSQSSDPPKQPLMYSVVLSDAPLIASGSTSTRQQRNQHEWDHQKGNQPADDAHACYSQQLQHQHQLQQELGAAADGGWHQVRRAPKASAGVLDPTPSAMAADNGSLVARTAEDVQITALLQPPSTVMLRAAASIMQQQQQGQLDSQPGAAGSLQQQQQQQSGSLRGAAQLVLHPDGCIAGHFLASSSSSSSCGGGKGDISSGDASQQQQQLLRPLCLGLQARQVLGIHSCYRDPEWALLRLTIIKYSSSSSSSGKPVRCRSSSSNGAADGGGSSPGQQQQQQQTQADVLSDQQEQQGAAPDYTADKRLSGSQGGAAAVTAAATAAVAASGEGSGVCGDAEFEAEAWVQRTGGDLVTLEPADMGDEDTAAAILQESLGLEPDLVRVVFTPHTLLAGAAADRQLAVTWPALVGSGVVVNRGDMVLENLPVGMLD